MRSAWVTGVSVALAASLAGCGDKAPPGPTATPGPGPDKTAGLTVDQSWINAAQDISDRLGGCVQAKDAIAHESRVVTLEKLKIVMLTCSANAYTFTNRLFAVVDGKSLQLLSLPDYDATGWFASDQASMAELDAGAGVLTTQRTIGAKINCGSEGRYQWTGGRFELQELRFQDCADKNPAPPPFPVIWPMTVTQGADLSNSAPAP